MRFWFARGSEIPIRRQLVTQVALGVLCGDLAPGERLPSTREMARRFRVHPNTVSAAYRQLREERWVEFRHGSGVYVRRSVRATAPESPEQLIANLVLESRRTGLPLHALRAALSNWLDTQPPSRFVLVEPDDELRRIVLAELNRAVSLPVEGCGFAELRSPRMAGAAFLVLPSKADAVRERLPSSADLIVLQVRSAPSSLAEWLPAPAEALVGVASRWPGFLAAAHTMLTAAGFSPDALVVRDARVSGWQADMECTAAVVCDVATAGDLPKRIRSIVFPIVSATSLLELQQYEEYLSVAEEKAAKAP
ncbi:MAG: GntR family transcriptional regulator [Acidobacteriaceae bacterium]